MKLGGTDGLFGIWREEVSQNEQGEEVRDIPQEKKNQLLHQTFKGIAKLQPTETHGRVSVSENNRGKLVEVVDYRSYRTQSQGAQ